MTSLSSLTSSSFSPRTQMNARIAAAVSAGTISSTDQTALSSALDGIDSSLTSGTGAASSTGGSVKDKIDTLIQQQVSNGTLTDDQASELQSFFAQGGPGPGQMPPPGDGDASGDTVASVDGMSATQGAQGPRGPGPMGPPPPLSADDGSSDGTTITSSTSTSTDATDTGTASSTVDDELTQLGLLLDKLRQSLAPNLTYGTGSATASSGLVVNGTA